MFIIASIGALIVFFLLKVNRFGWYKRMIDEDEKDKGKRNKDRSKGNDD
jgi:hypothetical protein